MSVPHIRLDNTICTVRRIRTVFPENLMPFGYVVEFTISDGSSLRTRLLWEVRVANQIPVDMMPMNNRYEQGRQIGMELMRYCVLHGEISQYMLLAGHPNLRVTIMGTHGHAEFLDLGTAIFKPTLEGDWRVVL